MAPFHSVQKTEILNLGTYLHRGSKPVCVKFDIIFGRLLEKIPAVVVRVLSFSYREQLGWIKWGRDPISDTFGIKKGTRQGSVACPTFWSVYLNPLIEELRAKGIGYHVGGLFVGVVAYADDLVLLEPNRSAAQHMLETCEKFVSLNNIQFSTNEDPRKSKSKVMFVTGSKSVGGLPHPLFLFGKELSWVDRCEHVGHTLTSSGTMVQDCHEKRAGFIDSVVKTRECFKCANPYEVMTATQKYCDSHYSAQLYDLQVEASERLYASWRTCETYMETAEKLQELFYSDSSCTRFCPS